MTRRTKSRSKRKPREQLPLPDGEDGAVRFADTSEITFDFSTDAPAAPKRSIQRASRPTAPPKRDEPSSEGGSGSEMPPAPEPPRRRKDAAENEEEPRPRPKGAEEIPRIDITDLDLPGAPVSAESDAELDPRRARVTREVPAPPATRTGNGRGNGKPPSVTLPPPPAPPISEPPRNRPRLKKLRILLVLVGLAFLAMVSTVFGMMMAVSQDLPSIENFAQFKATKNSVLLDDSGAPLGTLTSNENRIVLASGQISQNVKSAAVAIEDKRFYEHGGVDFQGIARALFQDVLHGGATQGASTITEQFVKNALDAQGSRTVFEKLREAALAYHLEKKWSKDKILTEYLNTIYFGEGAYGIESAARTYFGWNHPGCGQSQPCASVLLPGEAATLAGIIASPSAYDPKQHPLAAKQRRNQVLANMLSQGYITDTDYHQALITAMPAPSQIHPPTIDSKSPYFTTWLRQVLVDKYGPGKAFFGGLKVHTTLDLGLQSAVEHSISSYLGAIAPTGSAVVINNRTGGIKAMVGGPGYSTQQFNIATQGARQPGSSWKLFDLVSALKLGHSPSEVWSSKPKTFYFGKHHNETFTVHNDENNYSGSLDLTSATEYSDNSVFADLSLHLKKNFSQSTHYIAQTAHAMGISSPISTNPAMVIGGLQTGVNPLEMAHAYSTLASDGKLVSGTLASRPGIDPVGLTKIEDSNGHVIKDGQNKLIEKQVIPASVSSTARTMLGYVVSGGTGVHAAVPGYTVWGKTGTTENNGDAWFCGTIEDMTACVWVGHADSVTPMKTDYAGGPVMGGTYPALIWHDIAMAWLSYKQNLAAARARHGGGSSSSTTSTVPSTGYTPSTTYTAPAPSSSAAPSGGGGNSAAPAPATPAAPAPAPSTPAPSSPAPSSGSLPTGGAGPAGRRK